MSRRRLTPDPHLLAEEYVLVQAWKKAHDYIRWHNWYSDVLELDLTNADLDRRLKTIAEELRCEEPIRPDPLRLVLAPKAQEWAVHDGVWRPVNGPTSIESKLRPLAHITVRDQIIGTAFMMLVADIVESSQGYPAWELNKARKRNMVSYGNRLFCDSTSKGLRFRWGSSVLYRQYFQDYERFLARPREVVESEFPEETNWAIVSADLSQFYDRVRPDALHEKLEQLMFKSGKAESFMERFRSFFDWQWDSKDEDEALKYAVQQEPAIENYDRIALPQGHVAAAFFSNVVLLDVDAAICRRLGQWNDNGGWRLVDYCRYCDDMRFVVELGAELADESETVVADAVSQFAQRQVAENANDLLLKPEKCDAVLGRETAAGTIRVSETMQRINRNTSGPVDLFVAEETMDLTEGLLFSQQDEPLSLGERFRDTFFSARPDVRDETVARFVANRFRKTFRSLRPLCDDPVEPSPEPGHPAMSREVLDGRAALFCRRLIEKWIRDPSNMRLLRVAFDIYPDAGMLEVVLALLRQYLNKHGGRKAPRRVAWYCAAELLKAGATETGLVTDSDCLPEGVELVEFQAKLVKLAKEIDDRRQSFPWFLQQQALLFLACTGNHIQRTIHASTSASLKEYLRLHDVLAGRANHLTRQNLVPFVCIVAKLTDSRSAAKLVTKRIDDFGQLSQRSSLRRIIREDSVLAEDVWMSLNRRQKARWRKLFLSHAIPRNGDFPQEVDQLPQCECEWPLLAVTNGPANPFQQEYAVLQLAMYCLKNLDALEAFTGPDGVSVTSRNWRNLWRDKFPFRRNAFTLSVDSSTNDARFTIPSWIPENRKWSYQLGQLIRVAVTGLVDFTNTVDSVQKHRSLSPYVPYRSSWLRRRYGMFQGRGAFGPSWLPISSWFETLMCRLLAWPGFSKWQDGLGISENFTPTTLFECIQKRVRKLNRQYGSASNTPILEIPVPRDSLKPTSSHKSATDASDHRLRVGVVQSVLPRFKWFEEDPRVNQPEFRRDHRRHLSAVLGAVRRMLQVRATHPPGETNIDLLVMPELSVHESDLRTHLVPFAVQHRCIVLAGVVFRPVRQGSTDLINTACWIIPSRNSRGGLQTSIIEQGKRHLTEDEKQIKSVVPFRPAQWVIQFTSHEKLLWSMSGAICYDATDLQLASDLSQRTDMFVVPALNRDVGTFDNMVAALHYHMFQHVIIANTGEFGGSTAQAPFKNRHRRTIFHSHGNEQVSIGLFEVNLGVYKNGATEMKNLPAGHSGRSIDATF